MRAIILVFVVISLGSCASGPKQYNFTKQRLVQVMPDVVQQRVLGWCAQNGFAVTSSTSEMLIAKSDLALIEGYKFDAMSGASVDSAVSDCGKHGLVTYRSSDGNLTVMFRPKSGVSGSTDVTVTFIPFAQGVQCVSNGRIERMLFDFITQ